MNRPFLFCILCFVGFWASPVFAQAASADAIASVNDTDDHYRLRIGPAEADLGPAVLFLFGAFCALWAQNTGRNPWLWFFLGFLFSVITIFFLLTKNANDLQERKIRERVGRS